MSNSLAPRWTDLSGGERQRRPARPTCVTRREVRGASVQRIGSVQVVALELRDPERFIRRLPSARQFIARKALEDGPPGLYLTLVGTDGDPRKIAEVINGRVEGRGSRV